MKNTHISVMSVEERFFYFFFILAGTFAVAVFGIWWFSSSHIPQNFPRSMHFIDFILFGFLSYVVWYQIVMELHSWDLALSMKKADTQTPAPDYKVSFLTAFVPGKEPYEVLEGTLRAMINNSYSHDTWLLDEGNDRLAKKICKSYGVKHFSRFGISKYNEANGKFKVKTKGGNYNSWFDKYGGDYDIVAQLDVDFVPRKDYLLKTLGYFNDDRVAFVGTPQIYGNTKNSWIAGGAAEQAYGFYGFGQRGLFGKNMQLFIGSNHVVRVKAHNDIEGYAGHIVEDHLTGMKFYSKKWKSVYVPEILAVGEGPSTWDAYFNQQMRWAFGLFDILFKHSPKIFTKLNIAHTFNYFILQNFYFYGLAQFIGIFLLALYLFFGINSAAMGLSELLILYIPVLYIQQVIFIWLQKFYINPDNESGFHLKGKLLNLAVWPIYFIALCNVLTGKKLNYKVTPKGIKDLSQDRLSLFIPHMVLGGITAAGFIASFYTHHQALHLLALAIFNTLVMYSFITLEVIKKINLKIRKFHQRQFINYVRKLKSSVSWA